MSKKVTSENVWKDILSIRNGSPLIHNITNYVVMEKTANCLLAIGASPVMAHAIEEVAEMTGLSQSLVINLGTLSTPWIDGIMEAVKAANAKKIPVVLDPVGAGATTFRTKTALSIMSQAKLAVIRANASEIASLDGAKTTTKGVDSLLESSSAVEHAKSLARSNRCVLWMSGKTDVITDGNSTIFIDNGSPMMGKVTGMGCCATALTGAFLAINANPFLAAVHACIVMGVTGEIAASEAKGSGTFNVAFLDALHLITFEHIRDRMRVREE